MMSRTSARVRADAQCMSDQSPARNMMGCMDLVGTGATKDSVWWHASIWMPNASKCISYSQSEWPQSKSRNIGEQTDNLVIWQRSVRCSSKPWWMHSCLCGVRIHLHMYQLYSGETHFAPQTLHSKEDSNATWAPSDTGLGTTAS